MGEESQRENAAIATQNDINYSVGQFPGGVKGGAIVPIRGTTRNITATTVSQQILQADANRKLLIIVNNDAVADAYIAFGIAATLSSFKLAKGGGGLMLDNPLSIPTSAMEIIGTTVANSNIVLIVV